MQTQGEVTGPCGLSFWAPHTFHPTPPSCGWVPLAPSSWWTLQLCPHFPPAPVSSPLPASASPRRQALVFQSVLSWEGCSGFQAGASEMEWHPLHRCIPHLPVAPRGPPVLPGDGRGTGSKGPELPSHPRGKAVHRAGGTLALSWPKPRQISGESSHSEIGKFCALSSTTISLRGHQAHKPSLAVPEYSVFSKSQAGVYSRLF